jgi:hypothetical protein
VGLYKAGEVDKATDLLLQRQLDPDLSLSDKVSVNLLIADMGTFWLPRRLLLCLLLILIVHASFRFA